MLGGSKDVPNASLNVPGEPNDVQNSRLTCPGIQKMCRNVPNMSHYVPGDSDDRRRKAFTTTGVQSVSIDIIDFLLALDLVDKGGS